jgi:hypothetical protein
MIVAVPLASVAGVEATAAAGAHNASVATLSRATHHETVMRVNLQS